MIPPRHSSFSTTALKPSQLPKGPGLGQKRAEIADKVVGFIYQNGFYLHPEGDNNFPYDVISGYTVNNLESKVVADAYCQSSLVQELKAHKQGNANNRMIDFYFNFNF